MTVRELPDEDERAQALALLLAGVRVLQRMGLSDDEIAEVVHDISRLETKRAIGEWSPEDDPYGKNIGQ